MCEDGRGCSRGGESRVYTNVILEAVCCTSEADLSKGNGHKRMKRGRGRERVGNQRRRPMISRQMHGVGTPFCYGSMSNQDRRLRRNGINCV